MLPASVLSELQSQGTPTEVQKWSEKLPVWVAVKLALSLIPVDPELSLADREAISLAREMNALLLMDDRRARLVATRQAVGTIGTLGILEAAAAKGLISLPTALERLRATNMFISAELLAQALRRDSARRGD